ncbi:transposase [Bradyrhizobium ottawaense]|uniref:transposase n=1 Tax=Bradyrhizobium ottawaense TaxID=931866 RepID=UPI003F9FA3E3
MPRRSTTIVCSSSAGCTIGVILAEVRRDLAAWLGKWGGKYPKLTGWVEENIDETLTYFRLPLMHCKHMKSTMLEGLNEESGGTPTWCESSPTPKAV